MLSLCPTFAQFLFLHVTKSSSLAANDKLFKQKCKLNVQPLSRTAQVDELRMRVRELEERERKESKKLADEDALRKIRVAEETIEHLQKKLAATKQVSVCFVLSNIGRRRSMSTTLLLPRTVML